MPEEPEQVLPQQRRAALVGSKKFVPKLRSSSSIVTVAASDGSARTIRYAEIRFVHTNSGMRPQPMPGARMLWIVAMKLIAPRIEARPVRWTM